jgi:hypothetical protein
MSEIKIKTKFEGLKNFLVGNPQQFLVYSGNHYCVRDGCEGCPYVNNGCEFQEETISTAVIPPARRAIGFEEKSFLVLQLLPGIEFKPSEEENENIVPMRLWNTPYDHFSQDERNLHFILSDMDKPFRVMKGQFRFYGTKSEFENSEYCKYFSIYEEYVPENMLVAFDFSAIEPRGSAIATQEPEWLKIYEGTPKVIVREIELTAPIDKQDVSCLYLQDDHIYCFLQGELDKATFPKQCENCKIPCRVAKEFTKNVPGDFHSLNAKAFFSNDPEYRKLAPGELPNSTQSEILKEYRNCSKICGLAAVYGASARTLMKNMKCNEVEAQKRLNNFFALLTKARRHMLLTEQNILNTGISRNFFGRIWDLSRFVNSKAETEKKRRQDVSYAVRVGYNHPIQSSMAEALKMSMIRIEDYIVEQKLNPLAGYLPSGDLTNISYRDMRCAQLLSIHDEIDFLIQEKLFDTIIPAVYEVLQIKDIIKSLGVDFLLEMDVEYDLTRSFTSTTQYPAAKIYLLNTILPKQHYLSQANTVIFKAEDVTEDILQKLSADDGSGRWRVAFQEKDEIYLFPKKISDVTIKNIKGEKKIAVILSA